MVGAAFAFVDPMFSTGVYLAMNSAFEAAAGVDPSLRGDIKKAGKQFRRYDQVMRRGPKMFSWFIYRITSPANRKLFMRSSNLWRMQEALLSVLAGDLFRSTPIGPRFLAFKFIYYRACLTILPQAVRTFLWRLSNVRRDLQEAGGA